MVHFVGAGPGAPDLLTLRGAALLERAGCIIYAGSLVNPALLARAKDGCVLYNSAEMTLEEVLAAIQKAETAGADTVRLHTGDPCVYGAVKEQMDALDALGIPWDDTPGVSSFRASMVIFLSAGMLDRVEAELLAGGYPPETPAALVYKATWPEEKLVRCTVGALAASGEAAGIRSTALVLAGDFLGEGGYERSKLYDPAFTTGYREGRA